MSPSRRPGLSGGARPPRPVAGCRGHSRGVRAELRYQKPGGPAGSGGRLALARGGGGSASPARRRAADALPGHRVPSTARALRTCLRARWTSARELLAQRVDGAGMTGGIGFCMTGAIALLCEQRGEYSAVSVTYGELSEDAEQALAGGGGAGSWADACPAVASLATRTRWAPPTWWTRTGLTRPPLTGTTCRCKTPSGRGALARWSTRATAVAQCARLHADVLLEELSGCSGRRVSTATSGPRGLDSGHGRDPPCGGILGVAAGRLYHHGSSVVERGFPGGRPRRLGIPDPPRIGAASPAARGGILRTPRSRTPNFRCARPSSDRYPSSPSGSSWPATIRVRAWEKRLRWTSMAALGNMDLISVSMAKS